MRIEVLLEEREREREGERARVRVSRCVSACERAIANESGKEEFREAALAMARGWRKRGPSLSLSLSLPSRAITRASHLERKCRKIDAKRGASINSIVSGAKRIDCCTGGGFQCH